MNNVLDSTFHMFMNAAKKKREKKKKEISSPFVRISLRTNNHRLSESTHYGIFGIHCVLDPWPSVNCVALVTYDEAP